MHFLKSLVSSITSPDASTSSDTRSTMATISTLTSAEMELFHRNVWGHFDSMAIEPLSATVAKQMEHRFNYLASRVVDPINDDGELAALASPKSFQLNNTRKRCTSGPQLFEPTVATNLFELKSKLGELERRVLSADAPQQMPASSSKQAINLDKVSGLITQVEALLGDLEREVIGRQDFGLASITSVLHSTSSSIEAVDTALMHLSILLTKDIHQIINALNVDQLILLVAGQLRAFWTQHYPNYQRVVIFDSQLDIYFENLFGVLVAIINAPFSFARKASLPVLTELLDSLLPYLAVTQNFSIDCTIFQRHLFTVVSQQLFAVSAMSQYPTIGFDPTTLLTAILRLLHSYATQAIIKPETNLPPLNYPQLYATSLGHLLQNVVLLHLRGNYNTRTLLDYNSLTTGSADLGAILVELYEPFTLYSGFEAHQKPLGLDAIKAMLHSFIRCLGVNIWEHFAPLDRLLTSKGIDPNGTALYKYVAGYHARPVVVKQEPQETEETKEPTCVRDLIYTAISMALQEPTGLQRVIAPEKEKEPEPVSTTPPATHQPPVQTNMDSEVSLDLSSSPSTSSAPAPTSSSAASQLTTKIVEQPVDYASSTDEEPMIVDAVSAASHDHFGQTAPSKRSGSNFLKRIFSSDGRSSGPYKRPAAPPQRASHRNSLASSRPRQALFGVRPGSAHHPILIDGTVDGDSPSKKRKGSTDSSGTNNQPEDLSSSRVHDVIDLEEQNSPPKVAKISTQSEPNAATAAAVSPPEPVPSTSTAAPAATVTDADLTKADLLRQVSQMQQELLKSQQVFATLLEKLSKNT